METRKGSLTDAVVGVVTNKSETEIRRIQQEKIVRRTGTLEDSIANMYKTPTESKENPEK